MWSEEGCATTVATMSTRREALSVLDALNVNGLLDFLLTRKDVTKPKPDPEIYLMAAARADVAPRECMVIGDSPAGVQAGLPAGMNVIAASTPFIKSSLEGAPGVYQQWLMYDPEELYQRFNDLSRSRAPHTTLVTRLGDSDHSEAARGERRISHRETSPNFSG
jgi:beta-phosphoglucomutase-like phosphatase (HAD superfamily)